MFMVMSALALLAALMAELTYSTQINSRMAYNYVDNLKSYYLAKAALKLSLLRLNVYKQVKTFAERPDNKIAASLIGKNPIEQIWSFPLVFPPPIPKDASQIEDDNIGTFVKESKLSGSYTAVISSESSKLNLNNIFVMQLPVQTQAKQTTNNTQGAQKTTTATTTQQTNPNIPAEEMEFRPVLENLITSLLEKKKQEDREFEEIYRNVQGRDIVDAIYAYIFPDTQGSNLPGFKPIAPKNAPFYSLSELHLIPGITDDLYDLISPALTVYATPGINVNTIDQKILQALVPELTEEEAAQVILRRDDPDVGRPWNKEDDFWSAIASTSANRSLETIKERFRKANLKILTSESNFRIDVSARVGLSTKHLEAYVILDENTKAAGQRGQNRQAGAQNPATPPNPAYTQGQNPQVNPSTQNTSGLNLVYWRML